jgi:hypothetical protein
LDCKIDAVLGVEQMLTGTGTTGVGRSLIGMEWGWLDEEGVAEVWSEENNCSLNLGPMFSAVPGEIGPLLAGGGGEGGPLLAGGGGEGGPLLAGGGVQERENRGEVGLAVVQVWSLCLVRWTS